MELMPVIFGLVGGLALFLYGLFLLSEGLQKAAGDRLKELLERMTDRPIKGVAVGAVVTSIIQSSSITTVVLVGLINAGLMNLEQSLAVIMGANIGTTVTAQMVAFHVGDFALPMIAIGFVLFFFFKNKKYFYTGQAVLGFGLLFLGMNFMKDAAVPLRSAPFFTDALVSFSQHPVRGVAVSTIFTGIVQSSSATTALVVALGMADVITLRSAIPLLLGANIGTCITVLLASVGSRLTSKRAAVAHLIFNVVGVLIFLPFITPLANIVMLTSTNLPRQIANAHTIFNIVTTLMLLPFIGVLVFVVTRLLPGEEIKITRGAKFLDDRTLRTPSIALSQVLKETARMANIASEMLGLSIRAFEEGDKKIFLTIKKEEEAVDELHGLIDRYLEKIGEKDLSEEQMRAHATLHHSITDIERVADHAHNISELAEKKFKNKIQFSSYADEELRITYNKVKDGFDKAIKVLEDRDEELGKNVLEIEREIDVLEKEFEENHYKRLREGICSPDAGPIFVEMLRNLERISDHSHNIVNAVLIGF
ncbi:MAG: Na/Pi cotransporter family protein [Candidatus Hydrothermarchaeales archaeon]